MENKEKPEFLNKLAGLSEMFDKELSVKLTELYWESLKKLNLNDFIKACSFLANTCKFFPKPVEFFECIEGSETDKSNIALVRLEQAIEKYGYYYSVQFDDPVIHKVVDSMGGWMYICTLTLDDWKYRKQEFISMYKTFSKRQQMTDKQITDNRQNRLIGFFEQDNNARGFNEHIPDAILIGNNIKTDCKKLLS